MNILLLLPRLGKTQVLVAGISSCDQVLVIKITYYQEMKKLASLFASALVVLAMSSCATYQKSAPVLSVQGNNINTYVAADLDYEGAKKVEGIVESKSFCGIQLVRNGNKQLNSTNRYRGLSKTEKQALYRAKQNGNVDIILEPEFETETHKYFFGAYRTKRTVVKGWGVNVKGIKEDKSRSNVQVQM